MVRARVYRRDGVVEGNGYIVKFRRFAGAGAVGVIGREAESNVARFSRAWGVTRFASAGHHQGSGCSHRHYAPRTVLARGAVPQINGPAQVGGLVRTNHLHGTCVHARNGIIERHRYFIRLRCFARPGAVWVIGAKAEGDVARFHRARKVGSRACSGAR